MPRLKGSKNKTSFVWFEFRLPAAMNAEIERSAKEHGITRSKAARRLIFAGLEAQGTKMDAVEARIS